MDNNRPLHGILRVGTGMSCGLKGQLTQAKRRVTGFRNLTRESDNHKPLGLCHQQLLLSLVSGNSRRRAGRCTIRGQASHVKNCRRLRST